MSDIDLSDLAGKRIVRADGDYGDHGHPELYFDDGTAIHFEGVGYDGLWTDVIWWSMDPEGKPLKS